jgi:hypothetical protein
MVSAWVRGWAEGEPESGKSRIDSRLFYLLLHSNTRLVKAFNLFAQMPRNIVPTCMRHHPRDPGIPSRVEERKVRAFLTDFTQFVPRKQAGRAQKCQSLKQMDCPLPLCRSNPQLHHEWLKDVIAHRRENTPSNSPLAIPRKYFHCSMEWSIHGLLIVRIFLLRSGA